MPSRAAPTSAAAHALVILARVTVELSRLTPVPLREFGNSNAMIRVFMAIDERPGSTPSAIADRLRLDRSVVSRALRQLESAKLTTRRIDASDRRRVRVRLSARGRERMRDYTLAVAPVLREIAPLVDQFIVAIGASQRPESPSGHVSPAVALDRLGEIGGVAVAKFVDIERRYGVADWTQRFALWAVCDRVTDAAAISEVLGIASEDADHALQELARAGLIVADGAGAERDLARFEPTARGRSLLAAHADISGELELQLVEALEWARRAAALIAVT